MKRLILFLPMILLITFPVQTQQDAPPPVGIIEHLGQTIPMDEEFYDENGNLVPLKSVINKPTILTFVYFKCTGICSPLLNEMVDIVNKLDLEIGKEYQIFTLSFDPDEKPDMAKEKRINYLGEIKQNIDPNGWRFFTGDSASIHRLTDAAGFYFQRNGQDWIHAAGIIVVSPQGKVARYLYGIQQLPFDVKMALIDASEGRSTPTIAKILRFCYSYDAAGQHYAFDYLRVGFIAIIGSVAMFVGIFIVRPRMKNSRKDHAS